MKKIFCFLFKHKYKLVENITPTIREIKCTRCNAHFSMSDECRTVLPMDNELKAIHKMIKATLLILTICLFSCNDNTHHVKETRITLNEIGGWYETIICDSATMLNEREAEYWVNGFKGKVFATSYITISRN